MRIHRHISDLAGSGLVLIALLLGAMVISAVPAVVQSLTGRSGPGASHGPTVSGPSGHGPTVSGPSGHAAS